MKFLCRLSYHNWSNWYVINDGDIVDFDAPKVFDDYGREVYQTEGFYKDIERKCLDCNLLQSKRLQW